jgi:nucleotide-binding universal stress UspA family protein
MKTILYATDYSKNSSAALKYAHALSTKLKARLLVIHVFDYPTLLDHLNFKAEDPFPGIEGDAFKKHNAKLQEFCKSTLDEEVDTLNIETEAIESKSVEDAIVSKAKEVEALMIITGMKEGSALREVLLGSTTQNLLEKSPCPVLSIPADADEIRIKTIVYATDFEEEDLGAIDKLTEFAKPFKAKIRIVHLSNPQQAITEVQKKLLEEKLRKHIKYSPMEFDFLSSEDVFTDLKLYLGMANADIVAMLEREHKSLASQLFHRDMVKRMEGYGRLPLMCFNANNYGIFHF